MNASRLSWPTDRRLFRRERSVARGLPAFVVAIAAALIAAASWGAAG